MNLSKIRFAGGRALWHALAVIILFASVTAGCGKGATEGRSDAGQADVSGDGTSGGTGQEDVSGNGTSGGSGQEDVSGDGTSGGSGQEDISGDGTFGSTEQGECSGSRLDGASWEKHIAEETTRLPGVKGEYSLLFLTDTHVVIKDEGASEQEAENEAARYPEFVNAEGVPSSEQFSEWIRYANETQVDGVLLGGDIIDTPSDANLQWLEEELSRLDMPYLYVNGNHDWTYPWEYMTQAGRETYLPLLEVFMNGNTSIQKLDFGEFVVVGVDDSTDQVAAEALPEYEKILAESRPVITMAHVPFMTQSVLARAREAWSSPVVIGAGNFGGIYPNEDSTRFVELTTAAGSPVELVLAGHVHFYDKDVMEGEKDVLQIVGGAGFQGNAILIHVTGAE